MESCKICQHNSQFIFKGQILNRYLVSYYQCEHCKLIQTESPYWLDEAYSSAIGSLDIGLLYRNTIFSGSIPDILDSFTFNKDSYLDYGGGYGVFVRMMRDRGYKFYLYDKYCENLFAKHFDLDSSGIEKFSALTAFEVFEHLVDPISEILKMLELSDVIIFSTELQPDMTFKSVEDWWYFAPIGGQHVALYSLESLKQLAISLKCALFTNESNLHILTKIDMPNPFTNSVLKKESLLLRAARFVDRKFSPPATVVQRRESLLSHDFELVKQKVKI